VSERLILMGVIGRPHGVRGCLRVHAYTQDPDALAAYPLVDKTGRRFTLEWVGDEVAALTEITASGARAVADRNAAERLVNTELFAPRSALPEPEDEEFYLADLIGLAARDAAGSSLGTIAAVHDYGGGTSLEIISAGGGPRLVPFTRAAVPVVDIAGGVVVVDPPAETTAAP
jgi:16S rRNA processing protein RimM